MIDASIACMACQPLLPHRPASQGLVGRARFLTVWIYTLPIALYHNFQYATPLVSSVIAFLLVGVENIGVQVRPLHRAP